MDEQQFALRVESTPTTVSLLEKYNTYTRRVILTDKTVRRTVFKSFARTIGPLLPTKQSAKIMDVACGEGSLLLFLLDAGYSNISGFDISPENVEICGSLGLSFVRQFDALHLREFDPGVLYDVIVALDLLEHLPKQEAASFLRQVRCRIRPGGSLIIQTPNMGCVFGHYHRFNDLSHEFCLTEKSARDLMMVAGFESNNIEIRPAWNATTVLGYFREAYLAALHRLVFVAEDSSRPRIPTKNLLIRAWNR